MKHIASWSGGKDSTAMIDIMLREKMPLDYIVFMDTLMEFDEMYSYIEKVSEYWRARYSVEIVILKPTQKDFIDGYILSKIKYCREDKNKNKVGMIKGFLNPTESFCAWRRETKVYPYNRWLKQFDGEEITTYIGFTKDEAHRCKADANQKYPLYEMGMSDNDCQNYLKDREMENPLYKHFNRTGCRLCPYQSKRDWANIYKHYPKVWNEVKEITDLLKTKKETGQKILHEAPFLYQKNTEDYEREFDAKPTFEFDDEPLKDCLCKI